MTKSSRRIGFELVLWIFAAAFALPVVFVFVNSFKSFKDVMMTPLELPRVLQFSNYLEVWHRTRFHIVFANTMIYAAGSTALIILLTSMAAYKLARSRTGLSTVIFGLFVVPLIVPFQAVMIPIARMAGTFHLRNSIMALILISSGFMSSLGILLYHGFVSSVPVSVEESAIVDGCTGYNLFFRIVFPLLKPVTGSLIVIYFVNLYNQFLLPLILTTSVDKFTIPLSQMIMYSQFTNNRWNLVLTSGVLAIVPVLIVFLFSQRFIIKGLTAGAVKG